MGVGEATLRGDETAGVDDLGTGGTAEGGRDGIREGGVSTRGNDASQLESELPCENLLWMCAYMSDHSMV